MKAIELSKVLGWELVCGDGEREVTGGIYCCDLLSIVMGRAPADCLWVTVMGNVNAAAVATLTDAACVVVAERMPVDAETLAGAEKGGVTVFRSDKPVFETALGAAKLLNLV
ncbi:MAG: hypothetical protein ACOX66_03100 [Oscillospiraceae bacterium]|jgi:hypothetical protein